MGTKIGAQTQQNLKYSETVLSVLDLIVKRILQPWLQPNFIWKLSPEGRREKKNLEIVHGFTENVITERKKLIASDAQLSSKLSGTGKTRLAFLDLLLQASGNQVGVNRLTDIEIRNETDLFMVAGHDTSGVALAWTLFLISHHPEVQQKVHNELDEIFGDDRERPATSEDLTKMKYLEMCFKETLRLRPSIPFIFRSLT
jgi:cytochrome P450